MNIVDILIIAALAVALGLAARRLILNRRQGKCNCGCEGCAAKCDRRNGKAGQ